MHQLPAGADVGVHVRQMRLDGLALAIGRPNVVRRCANVAASSSARWDSPTIELDKETRL